jgi:hypothetical protein
MLAQARTGLAMLLAVGLLASCGGGGGGGNEASPGSSVTTTHHDMTTQSATPSTQELAQTYLRIVRPANAEIDRFTAKARSWNDETTNAQAAKDAGPVIAALEEADNELLRVRWPAAIRADVKALVRADGAVIGDLNGIRDAVAVGSWANQFSKDLGEFAAAVAIVRADLGLPPSN